MKANKILYSTLALSILGTAGISEMNTSTSPLVVQAKTNKHKHSIAKVIKKHKYPKGTHVDINQEAVFSNFNLFTKFKGTKKAHFKNKRVRAVEELTVRLSNGRRIKLLKIISHNTTGYVIKNHLRPYQHVKATNSSASTGASSSAVASASSSSSASASSAYDSSNYIGIIGTTLAGGENNSNYYNSYSYNGTTLSSNADQSNAFTSGSSNNSEGISYATRSSSGSSTNSSSNETPKSSSAANSSSNETPKSSSAANGSSNETPKSSSAANSSSNETPKSSSAANSSSNETPKSSSAANSSSNETPKSSSATSSSSNEKPKSSSAANSSSNETPKSSSAANSSSNEKPKSSSAANSSSNETPKSSSAANSSSNETPKSSSATSSSSNDSMANSSSTSSSQSSSSSSAEISSAIQVAFDQINHERETRGIAPLTIDPTLAKIASQRAEQIATNFSHTDSSGGFVAAHLADKEGYDYKNIAENIGQDLPNQSLSNSVLNDIKLMMYEDQAYNWGHRDNFLNKDLKDIGIGIYIDKNDVPYIAYVIGDKF